MGLTSLGRLCKTSGMKMKTVVYVEGVEAKVSEYKMEMGRERAGTGLMASRKAWKGMKWDSVVESDMEKLGRWEEE